MHPDHRYFRVADDSGGVAGAVGAGGVADSFAGLQAAKLAQGFHNDHGGEDVARSGLRFAEISNDWFDVRFA